MGKMKTAKRFALGTLFAVVAGYVAGILTAPKSGRDTREELRDATSNTLTSAERQLKRLHTDLARTIDEAKDTGDDMNKKALKERDDLIERAKDARQKAREILSSVHEGQAEDKELNRAIQDASRALEHLKKFLTK